MKRGLYKLSRTGHLRRLAGRDAADQTRQIKAFIRRVYPVTAAQPVPPAQVVAHDVASGPAVRIVDISQFGTTYCGRHRLVTVGNFCAACEQEAAEARVPMRKPLSNDPGRLVTDGGQGVTP